MSDNDVDDELLALADDDSVASEAEDTQPAYVSRNSKSISPPPRSPPAAAEPAKQSTPQPPRQRGVAQRKNVKSDRASAASKRRKEESDEEGEASSDPGSPESLGSGAMSESDSEASAGVGQSKTGDTNHFPVEGFYRSEKEREDINAMPEVERERLLAERAEETERLAQSAQLRQIMQAREKTAAAQKKRKAGSTDLEESPRKSSRAKTKQSENLAAYKRQREQRNEERRRGDDNRTARDKKSPSQENGYSDAEGDAEDDVEWDDAPKKASANREEGPPTLREYERVKVSRTNFAKVGFYPGFEDTIKGCFVRVAIGINKATGQNTYRMCQIKGFVKGRPYIMELSNGRSQHFDQYAILSHGKAEKEWPFIACSESKITDSEFERYTQAVVADGLSFPKRSFLEAKCLAIQELIDHRWTDDEISEKMRRQKAVTESAAGYERERLEKQKKLAVANGNDAEVARLDRDIAALNDPRTASLVSNATTTNPTPMAAKAQSQQDRLAQINRLNRKANSEEIRKAQIEEKRREQAQKQAMLRGEATANPFARVKTRAKVHHDASGKDSLAAPGRTDDLFGSDISRGGTPTPGAAAKNGTSTPKTGLAAKGGLKKSKIMDDDILGSMDLGIEIDI